MKKAHSVALLFNANKSFDRDIMGGIAAYLGSTRSPWEVFLEQDLRLSLADIEHWQCDAIIADFDDPAVADACARSRRPVVAVGGSYASEADYPRGRAYVATDNFKLVKLARDHLIESGLQSFAMYSLPDAPGNRWAQERERAFSALAENDRMAAEIFRGCATSASSWHDSVQAQLDWLRSLPKPVGIIAVTDARARQLMQACFLAGINVPEQVAIIGIDNDPLVGVLTPIPLSSVVQGAHEMGRTAAHLAERMVHGVAVGETRILVPPAGIKVCASSQHQPGNDPRLMRARHFIRQHACQSVKTGQVADYVGVSRSWLENFFREKLGCSVHEVVMSSRLDAAKARLEGGASVADVARDCGFGTTQYMHLVFKRELGYTPRAYRDRALGRGPFREAQVDG